MLALRRCCPAEGAFRLWASVLSYAYEFAGVNGVSFRRSSRQAVQVQAGGHRTAAQRYRVLPSGRFPGCRHRKHAPARYVHDLDRHAGRPGKVKHKARGLPERIGIVAVHDKGLWQRFVFGGQYLHSKQQTVAGAVCAGGAVRVRLWSVCDHGRRSGQDAGSGVKSQSCRKRGDQDIH